MELSVRRADTLKELLVKSGVREEYIQIEYYGESKPIVPTEDNVDEPLNRRVEVVVR
jgi:outer membrane protein OmpA-like peptidoglycan-associated protein